MKSKIPQKTISIGIGGNIGSGKTTVARELIKLCRNNGERVKLLDADKIAWKLYRRKNPLYSKIIKIFGTKVLKKDKEIDRKKLAKIVFNNSQNLQKLNKIIHPALIRVLNNELRKRENAFKILDAALLFYWGKKLAVKYRILVTTPKLKKISRMIKRGYQTKEVEARLNQQMKESEMRSRADFVINNNGSITQLKNKIKILYKIIMGN